MIEKQVLIIGGRQSALEWAALINEAGAKSVHLVYSHETPNFFAADSTWMHSILDENSPAWYRNLSDKDKQSVDKRAWIEARLNVEPWLKSRVIKPNIHLHSKTKLVSCSQLPSEMFLARLNNNEAFAVDQIILATGYRVDLHQIPFLREGNLLEKISVSNGFPVLDEHLQSSIRGLFITGMPAMQDFGSFFEFTIAARVSARIIGNAILKK